MTARDDCTAARRAISGMRSRVDDDPTLMLALERMIVVEEELFPDRAAYEAAAHAETCAACQDWAASWLDVQYPERVAHRARIGKYCCISMFDAVTGPEAAVRFSFELFRGEDPTWCINEQYAFARFCPWCGQRLPDQPFEPGA